MNTNRITLLLLLFTVLLISYSCDSFDYKYADAPDIDGLVFESEA